MSESSKQHLKNNTNIIKFLARFPHSKPPPLSPHSNEMTTRCPMMISNIRVSIDQELSPTQTQIDLVRTSWQKVTQTRHDTDDRNVSPSHAFGLAFYDALFEMEPDCRELFTNVFQQARALTGMISYIARAHHVAHCCPTGLDSPPSTPTTIKDINEKKKSDSYDEGDPEWLAQQLRELGARHYFYKVKPHHLELVGPAFAAALKKRLGSDYTAEIGDAWVKANSYAAYNMKIGFESQQAWEEGITSHRSIRKRKATCIIS